ncbi:MAG: tetratricopeptide repeat protein [Bacteroidales bacterium]|uniref:tetratricopeptide repeat protein n=1 Tax=Porphyromonas sp. TaxID=1924944 RepID=UPI002976B1C5|nr:tetratricopeptide repeat protein [Porphyromonas sp.]MDD7438852.1 tetratricopeptide repeat protein [Bacteroidales bacterium]MDY3067731.1 tetratricopeptide repeat protein [Porphyromonas sp.]
MKKGLLLLSALMVSLFSLVQVSAQTGVASGTPFGHGNDSIQCRRNITFYKTYHQSQNFKDAYDFWKKVYDNCPGASKDTYIIGKELLNWKVDQAQSDAEKIQFVDQLMEMYDTRIKYFGDDENAGKDFILGDKVSDYMRHMGNATDYNKIYSWLAPVVKELGANTDPLALSQFAYASMAKMFMDPSLKEQYVNEHLMVDSYYDQKIKEYQASGNEKAVAAYQGYKENGQAMFAQSGAASCDVMEEVYGPQVESKKSDKEWLSKTVALLQSVGCVESDVYFAMSEHLFNLEPTPDAATGIANKAYKEGNFNRAREYYEKAIDLSSDNSKKGEIYYMLAVMSQKQGSFASARNYANQALNLKSNFGAPMILIANMYAASAKSIYPDDPIKQRIVYCLVVDKAQRAKAIDGSVAAQANDLIHSYSQHFPAKEDVFMHPDLNEGASFTVGGWIGETTTIRTK